MYRRTMIKKNFLLFFLLFFFCFQSFADNKIYQSGPFIKDDTNGTWFDRSLFV